MYVVFRKTTSSTDVDANVDYEPVTVTVLVVTGGTGDTSSEVDFGQLKQEFSEKEEPPEVTPELEEAPERQKEERPKALILSQRPLQLASSYG